MPYWRLSSFYLFYFASLGALLPYWALYLKHAGFSSLQIGQLVAILMATKIISPIIWGWIADHTGHRMRIVRAGAFLSFAAFMGVFSAQGYWSLALVMLVFSFFWNAVLPQFEATTLTYLGEESYRYSNIRMWGSVGFIGAVAGLGLALDRWEPTLLPYVLLALFAGIWFTSLAVPERGNGQSHLDSGSLFDVLRRREVLALIGVSFLLQASHGPYYTFYTIYMESYGYSRGLIGQLWALGVVAEVGVFLVMHRLVPAYGLRRLLLLSLVLTTARWLLIGLAPDYLALMLFAQVLHAASFGVFHAVAIALFHRHFIGRHQGRGQALYSSASFGAGGAVGSLFSGFTWDALGATVTYAFAALLSTLAFWLAKGWIKSR